MDHSLTNFGNLPTSASSVISSIVQFFAELTESTIKANSDSDHGSEKSETLEIVNIGDADQFSTNGSKSDDDFDNNLPETVTLLQHEPTGAKVYLVGTAHFSNESKQDVTRVLISDRYKNTWC